MRSTALKIALIGHSTADLPPLAKSIADHGLHTLGLPLTVSAFETATTNSTEPNLENFDLAFFAMSAHEGLDQEILKWWEAASDLSLPRALLITKIEDGEADFDEAILIARRVLDNFTTPYLVLHDDGGAPCALINLNALSIHDYSTAEFKIYPCDEDHKVVIQEFREEYLASLEEFGEDTFVFGLFIPAIPLSVKAEIGFNEVIGLIKVVNDQQSL
ncbi:MAG: hypothetical protein F2657_02305 [Actinobacteria bacterium]|uniref:Unannotated protein n=1 Tax=freshwater metagenome TaxID=449393 RepID=A0A6J6MZH4_9ZZZZ|nr:hypothetical protein [Actinomycetota bacterium]